MKRYSRLLVLLLILTVVFAFGYAAIESVHDCHGEESCPICRIIAVLSAFLGAFAWLAFALAGFLRVKTKPPVAQAVVPFVTPVELKVKLLN